MSKELFVTCPKGIEPLLFAELSALNVGQCQQTTAGVAVYDDLKTAYRICLWSRLANRVLLRLHRFSAPNATMLYRGISDIDWLQHMSGNGSLVVDFAGTSAEITNTLFGAQKVKDAVVDQLRDATQQRPQITKINPDLRINVYLDRHQQATVSLDLSGSSLHQRGYRVDGGEAPLKENLAAAILIRSNWPVIAQQQGSLLDPMCGSGTLLIEGLLLAANIAPGLLRQQFGFERWRQHDQKIWQALLAEAQVARLASLAKPLPTLVGYDHDAAAIAMAQANARRCGLADYIQFSVAEIAQLKNSRSLATGLIVCNPPYGQRLAGGDDAALEALYQRLATQLRQHFLGWQASLFTGKEALCAHIGMRPSKKYQFYNGTLLCKLFLYPLNTANFFNETVVTP